MRSFVMELAAKARASNPRFLVLPQNGQELFTDTGEADGLPQTAYLSALNGSGRESMFYGYTADDAATPADAREHLRLLCRLGETYGVKTLATDYCSTPSRIADSYAQNAANGFVSFAATDRNLATIPAGEPYRRNTADITSLASAKNVLYLINGANYADAGAFTDAVAATDYDVIIMDCFQDGTAFSPAQIARLKTKHSGGSRIVLCYLSIGEAENYRYYWKSSWKPGSPAWLDSLNPNWPGNYKVRYWDPGWKSIVFSAPDSYLSRILAAGFDGVYLDIIDAFEYFEEKR